MHLVKVAPGIQWVEFPEADLRILCGCPADSVKHLMKRGLVVSAEEKGVAFETGPNAILLSDLSLQGGEFCNLAEFPVLQMLYRQGMMLPGHPNNKGTKPLLIGLEEQVDAQLEYIFRGNYGLASVEELTQAGVDPETAAQWIRMKLRFAFGAIKASHELLDVCLLGEEEREIRDGVVLRRIDVNLFEFIHRGQRVLVDLNLGEDERYQPPYPLNHHILRREYFAVVHSGEGDGWDVNRPTMSSILMYQGKIFLIDAGPNIHATLTALGIGIHEVDGLFHTHCHDDHFAGLTTLVRADHRVRYFATPEVRASVTKKLAALMAIDETAFGDFFDLHDLRLGEWNDIDGLEVKPMFSPHPVEATIFQFRAMWEGGYRTYGHYADIASFKVMKGMITSDPEAPGVSEDMVARVHEDYLTATDVKKLDVGGGMIHGDATDFRNDASGKIILAHTALELTNAQKEIGSGAPFGTVDVLIPARQDYLLRHAHAFLSSYFPSAPPHMLRMLLNHEVRTFNPETILLREGTRCSEVFLILSGLVEAIDTERDLHALLTAGALVGDLYSLDEGISQETYRAACFANALAVPVGLYREFIVRNRLVETVSQMVDLHAFFNRTWLLGENVSAVVKHTVGKSLAVRRVAAGEEIVQTDVDVLVMVHEGVVDRILEGSVVDVVREGEFFGEAMVLFRSPPICRFRARQDTELFEIPGRVLRNVPVVRWKLFEVYQRRMRHLVASQREGGGFQWLPDYAIGVPMMDRHHQTLFEIASRVIHGMTSHDPTMVTEAMEALVDYTCYHFGEEEALLERYRYPATQQHHDIHRQLIAEVRAARERLLNHDNTDPGEFRGFFEHWIIEHILNEDRRYAQFLKQHSTYSI